MKIILEENDLKEALEVYVNKLGMSTKGQSVNISFTASRAGGKGYSAELNIKPKAQADTISKPHQTTEDIVLDETNDDTVPEEPDDATNPFTAAV